MGYYVPEAMRTAKRWGLWRLEAGKKIPYNAKTTGKASPTDRNAWTDYEATIAALKNGEFNGLGFAIFPEDRIVFIDLDNCIMEDGEPSEFAESILALFPGTYTEYSQSESGLHIIARGVMPSNHKAKFYDEKKNCIMEIYSGGRYIAFTGNAYTAAEPAEAQAAINELCSRYNITAAPADAAPAYTQKPIEREDAEILEQARRSERNGADFALLWRGSWAEKYGSQSEGDYRLLEILYFYSQNEEQTARLFMQCPLADRPKARRGDYIYRTIKAIAANQKPRTEPQKAPQEPPQGGRRTNGSQSRTRRNMTDTPKKQYRRF